MSETPLSAQDLATLLCTRLCHDLAGPVGAVSAGAELLADETDAAFIAESSHLLRHSAEAASARLKFLRAAFGVSGRLPDAGSVKALASAYVAVAGDTALTMTWEEDAPALGEVPDAARLLLTMVLVALEAAHGAGRLEVATAQTADRLSLSVSVQGRRTGLSDDARTALRGGTGTLSARTVHCYWSWRLAQAHGGLRVEEGEGRLRLMAEHPVHLV